MSRTPQQRFEAGAILVVVEKPLRGRRAITLPDRVRGFPTDGRREVVRSGERWEGAGILVDRSPIHLALLTESLTDRDGVTAAVEVELVLDAPKDATTARLLADTRADGDQLDRATLARQLSDGLTGRVRRALSLANWTGENGLSGRVETGDFVEESLRAPLFERGLEMTRLGPIRVRSEDLESRRLEDLRRRESESEVRRRREELERWRAAEEARLQAKNEVEQARAEAERDEMQLRLDRRRAQRSAVIRHQLEEARDRSNLRRQLEREKWQLSTDVEEERLRGEIERAKRVEAELRSADVSDSVARLLAARWIGESDSTPAVSAAGSAPVRHLWLAAGVGLQRVEVGNTGEPAGRATPVLPTEDLGWIRSVSIDPTDRPWVHVGGQRGVGSFETEARRWECYRYPDSWVHPATSVRGGANGVVRTDRFVVASHSELGLCAWPRSGGEIARWGPSGEPFRACRALHRVGSHEFRFAAGRDVWRMKVGCRKPRFERMATLDSSVTALATHGGRTLAGTRGGRIFRVDPRGVTPLEFRSAYPVYSIARDASDPSAGWVVGTRESEVRVIDDEGRLVRVHRSRYPIRWVASGGGGVFGVDRMGLGVSSWRATATDGLISPLRVSDRIQSLAVEFESVERKHA